MDKINEGVKLEMLLKNKIAIVTGASQGIGKAIAKKFSEHGAITVLCSRNIEKLKIVSEEIEKITGNKTVAIGVDVSKKDEVDNVVKKVVELYSRIDILVNNASIQEFAPFLEMAEDFWDRHFDINVKGTFLFSQAVAKVMINKGGCRIINLSSDSGVAPIPPKETAAYCATKSAIIGLTRCIAKELGRYNIYCNAICPGAIFDTGMYEHYANTEGVGKGRLQLDIDATALGRIGYSKDVADVALFFASDLSSFVTGERLLVTGGDTMTQ
jgi:NAD(P)-dependent dehydrogenase (short-subunit alcohol dehydrogenase family)